MYRISIHVCLQRIEAVEAEAEKLRKQVELQRHQLEAANAAAAAQAAAAERAATLAAAEAEHKQAAAAAAAAAASSTADLAAAKQRISQLEEQLQAVQAVAPASAATQAPLRLPAGAPESAIRLVLRAFSCNLAQAKLLGHSTARCITRMHMIVSCPSSKS